jgi:serine/threonine-protein kinase/endoribonuclease IRE1
MLKAYHLSPQCGSRNILAFIESDGHPNVVRYFLKEVRGDFVYLALELCDLSLHDS